MKKIRLILLSTAALALLTIIGINIHLNKIESRKDSDVTLKNIEALSEESGDGGGGQTLSKCFKSGTEVTGYHLGFRKCNSSTTSTKIYPCPAQLTAGHSATEMRDCYFGN
ncbi:MAG: hypothetical protein LBD59_03760 [Prevotellaceae bacterium]|jgi:hypothetical protein|nr:hypothetical protein [Prevotellaceae bacterium]